jgi:hypothetical protein
MEDRRFDALAKRLGGSRRSLLKAMIGLGGGAAVTRLDAGETDAARRGYAGPGGGELGGRDYYTFCSGLEPMCCIQCYIDASDYDRTSQRFLACTLNHGSCADCAKAAQPAIGGYCWVS